MTDIRGENKVVLLLPGTGIRKVTWVQVVSVTALPFLSSVTFRTNLPY